MRRPSCTDGPVPPGTIRYVAHGVAADDERRAVVSAACSPTSPAASSARRPSTPSWPPAIADDDRPRRPAARRAGRPAPAGAAVRVRALAAARTTRRDPLARFYPNLTGGAPPAAARSPPSPRFCRDHADELRSSCWHPRRRRPTRSAAASLFLPAFGDARGRVSGRSPISTSAPAPGSTCSSTRYDYDYEPGGAVGRLDASVRLHVRHPRRRCPCRPCSPDRGRRSASTPTRSTSVTPTRRGGWRRACGPTRSSASSASRRRSHIATDGRRRRAPRRRRRRYGRRSSPSWAGAGHPVRHHQLGAELPHRRRARRQFVAALDACRGGAGRVVGVRREPGAVPELPGARSSGDDPNLPTALVLVRWRRRPARPPSSSAMPPARPLDALGLTLPRQPRRQRRLHVVGHGGRECSCPGVTLTLTKSAKNLSSPSTDAAHARRRSWSCPTARPSSRCRRVTEPNGAVQVSSAF